jgi:hypothetical protein
MLELEVVDWPTAPIETERLVVRPTEARDRAASIDLPGRRVAGVAEVERFEEFDAEQWFGVRR